MPELELSDIEEGSPVPVTFYPDLSRVRGTSRFGWLKGLAEIGLVFLASGRIAKAAKASSAHRIFAFFGGDPWFLLVAMALAWRTGLHLDIYLVDDLEESCRLNRQPVMARWVRWIEPKVLRRANRVFVISPGYAELLRTKYGITAEWLPIPFREEKLAYQPYVPRSPDVREIVYLGAINSLYLGALRDFLEVAKVWNDEQNSFKIRILLLTYTPPDVAARQLSGLGNWEVRYKRSTEERRKTMERSWAVLLPCAFEEAVRTMVSTSFPSRLSECMRSGRPLLVYGPAYGSLPRYFVANDLPACVQSRGELKTALRGLDAIDSSELIVKYQSVLNRYHSREAIAARLQDSVRGQTGRRFESV
jgi:hypothetical protein